MFRGKGLFAATVLAIVFLLSSGAGHAKEPKGAKAIFDSGEGTKVGMSLKTRRPETAKSEKFLGISYQLMLLKEDGRMQAVSKHRVFRTGERMKMIVRTNRSGYLTIVNIGSSGNTNILFNDYIEAYQMQEIPAGSNFRFIGEPGTEKVLLMLSNSPSPIGQANAPVTADAPPPPSYDTQPPSDTPVSADPGSASSYDSSALPPPPPVETLVANYEGSKGIKGAKDIMVEDSMQTSYSVISPKNNWKPLKRGGKDIVVESSNGSNYGVIPASAVADGGILTLEVKLKHR